MADDDTQASGGEGAVSADAAAADAPDTGETPAPEGEASGGAAGGEAATEQAGPKGRRRAGRAKRAAASRPALSPQERHEERLSQRRAKAVRRRARRLQERAKAGARRASAQVRAGAQTGELAPVHAAAAGKRKVRQGIVISDKAEKTITVRIDVARRHRRYEKIVRSSGTLCAHDENNDAREGDMVRVMESRPLSRTKRWTLIDVLERAE